MSTGDVNLSLQRIPQTTTQPDKPKITYKHGFLIIGEKSYRVTVGGEKVTNPEFFERLVQTLQDTDASQIKGSAVISKTGINSAGQSIASKTGELMTFAESFFYLPYSTCRKVS